MPRKKKVSFVDAFDAFWNHVQRAELDVQRNGHHGRLPPDCAGDYWDDDFVHAYELIRSNLRRFREARFFPVPVGMRFITSPLQTETAHQALLHFLNPPEELYGESSALNSLEYQAIKQAAMDELRQRDKERIAPWKPKGRICSHQARILGELSMLKGMLMEYHFPKGKEPVLKPLSQDQIAAKFDWSQPTTSRRMGALFRCKNGMDAYAAIFCYEMPATGYRRKFENGTLDVDAIFIHGEMDLDVDDTEQDD